MPPRLICILMLALTPASAARPRDDDSITVFAAASLTEVMAPIIAEFQETHGTTVHSSFGGSSTLARQVEAGAEVDVFISANTWWMDELQEQGQLVPGTRAELLSNRLVLVVPLSEGAVATPTGIEGLLRRADRIALADPEHVPAGMYARQVLMSMGLHDELRDHLIPTLDVRAAVRLVERGEVDAGIVYATDVSISSMRLVHEFDEALHDPIRYPVALCSDTPAARRFVAFLTTPPSIKHFESAGFGTLPSHVASAATAQAASPSPSAWPPVLLSLQVAFGCVIVVAIPGILMGWLLARGRFRGRMLLDAIVHLPLVLPPVVVGYLLLMLIGRAGPFGAMVYETFGVQLAFTPIAAVIASAVMGFPLLVRSVRLAVEMSDRQLEEAAATLGASALRRFLTITAPLAAPGILAGLVLAFARSLGEFGATMTVAGNIAGQTRTLPLAVFTASQIPGGDAAAIRLVVISIALSLGALVISELLARRMQRRIHA